MDYAIKITGGIGKHILSTSLIKWINEKYPKSKIIVISAYPEIFEYNPRIYRNLPLNHSYLFEDYIKGKDYKTGNPYEMYEYYRDKNKMHILKLFPKAYGFGEYDENPKTEIYLTKGEKLEFKNFAEKNKPIVTLQAFGGLPPNTPITRNKIDNSGRDMPINFALKIINLLKQKGIKVLQIRNNNEKILPGTIQLNNIPFRNLISIANHVQAHIGIDSSFMHATALFKKPQLIFWSQTHKDNIGYDYKGVINSYCKNGMHCRPHNSINDRAGVFPFKDNNTGLEWNYEDIEISKMINDLTKNIPNRNV
jgi:ADP-heptose:LPS heptosyltransferase